MVTGVIQSNFPFFPDFVLSIKAYSFQFIVKKWGNFFPSFCYYRSLNYHGYCRCSTGEPDGVNESFPEIQTDDQERPPSTKRKKLIEPERSPIGLSETTLVPDSIDINKSTGETLSNIHLKLAVADSFVADSLEIKNGTDCKKDEEPKGTEHIGHEMNAAVKTENVPDSLDVNPDHFIADETADIKPQEMKLHVQQQETNKENRRSPVNERHFDSSRLQAGFLCSKMPRKV